MDDKLRLLTELLEDAAELAPGVVQGAYGEGVLRFSVLVRRLDDALWLRVSPASFLPAPVASHPLVKTHLGDLKDLLSRGTLEVDDLLRAVVELRIDPDDDVLAVMRALHEDCVLLRAAAGGLAAAVPDQPPSRPSGTYEKRRPPPRPFERPAPKPPSAEPAARPAPASRGLAGSVTDRDDPDAWGRETRPRVVGFPDRRACLVVLGGPDEGRTFDLANRDAFCIGRSPHVEVRLRDDVCSRRNSLLTWTEQGTLRIEDLGSSNGTRVNGQVADQAELLPGDVIEVGWTKLRLELPTGQSTKREPPSSDARP